jgi:hypothetical protein
MSEVVAAALPEDAEQWHWPIDASVYDRTTRLYPDEKSELVRLLSRKRFGCWSQRAQEILSRLRKPVYDVMKIIDARPGHWCTATTVLLLEMHRRQRAFWGWKRCATEHAMNFIFADALDMIDPEFDFIEDRASPSRELYWGDVYPHEYFEVPPYDGVLVSRGIVGDHLFPGKYPEDLMMRFRRVGARSFLRLESKKYANMSIFGDCGAFSYVHMDEPPYSPDMMLDFYADGAFTHGCSVDHVIFDFTCSSTGLRDGSESAKRRFEITLENAKKFLKLSKNLGKCFTPLGVVQGWSPDSMAAAAKSLEKMGYRYLAIGGMVPLNAQQIHLCLQKIRQAISPRLKLHLLGFAKAE